MLNAEHARSLSQLTIDKGKAELESIIDKHSKRIDHLIRTATDNAEFGLEYSIEDLAVELHTKLKSLGYKVTTNGRTVSIAWD